MIDIKIGDKFKEYLYSDRRETSILDIKVGEVKSLLNRNQKQFILVVFDKKNQLKVTSEIEVELLEKDGDFWVRKSQ